MAVLRNPLFYTYVDYVLFGSRGSILIHPKISVAIKIQLAELLAGDQPLLILPPTCTDEAQ
jgi:hypothetical protein